MTRTSFKSVKAYLYTFPRQKCREWVSEYCVSSDLTDVTLESDDTYWRFDWAIEDTDENDEDNEDDEDDEDDEYDEDDDDDDSF